MISDEDVNASYTVEREEAKAARAAEIEAESTRLREKYPSIGERATDGLIGALWIVFNPREALEEIKYLEARARCQFTYWQKDKAELAEAKAFAKHLDQLADERAAMIHGLEEQAKSLRLDIGALQAQCRALDEGTVGLARRRDEALDNLQRARTVALEALRELKKTPTEKNRELIGRCCLTLAIHPRDL